MLGEPAKCLASLPSIWAPILQPFDLHMTALRQRKLTRVCMQTSHSFLPSPSPVMFDSDCHQQLCDGLNRRLQLPMRLSHDIPIPFTPHATFRYAARFLSMPSHVLTAHEQ